MQKSFFILIGLYLCFLSSNALNIKGRVIDLSTSTPLDYASVDLLTPDSVYVGGTQTNAEGIFNLVGQFENKSFLLKVSFLGYNTTFVRIDNLTRDVDLGDILLSEESKMLDEITVTGQRIINKVDKQIVFPDRLQVESSVNAFDLLGNMNLSRLIVDLVNRDVKIGRENVQMRINGVRATVQEVSGLRAKDIAHVEYYDDPGVRFGNEGVGAVIDFIVRKKRDSGGYVSIDARNSPYVGFGDDIVIAKFNHKKSEFSFLYYAGFRNYDKVWNENFQSFVFPDKTIVMEQDGIKKPTDMLVQHFVLSYNLTTPEKYVLNIGLGYYPYYATRTNAYNMNYPDMDRETLTNSYSKNSNKMPVLDIFFKYHLKNKQSLTFNSVGTYIYTDNKSDYTESDDNTIFTDIHNMVEGNKYSLITEALYNNEFDKVTFSAGIKHTQGYANNEYTGNNPFVSNMNNADSYVFAQLYGKFGSKVTYSLGLGAARVWFKEGENKVTFHTLRPSLRLSYKVNNSFDLRYTFNVRTSTPSLGQLSNVEQQIDSYQINRGNPDLKAYNRYSNAINMNYNKGIINAGTELTYTYSDNPFFVTYHIGGDKVIGLPENHRSFHNFMWRANVNLQLIKDIWSIGGWYELFRSFSNTNTTQHRYTGLNGRITSNFMYKKFNLNAVFGFRPSELRGETIEYGGDFRSLEVGYKHKEAKISLGMLYLFGDSSSTGVKNMSNVAPSKSWSYISDLGNMVYLRFSWNISFGRKYKAGQKTLHNTDDDKGIL